MKKATNLWIAIIATILFVFTVLYLGYEYRGIEKEGTLCLHDPTGYAENKIYEKTGETYYCECTPNRNQYNFNDELGISS